ncbi:hypothetical protein [Ferrimicrobium acidiphilum]|nr:hypothetical protein [Ferrimicrobium acidiphilum]
MHSSQKTRPPAWKKVDDIASDVEILDELGCWVELDEALTAIEVQQNKSE